jgi:hypothetical protein
MGLLNPNLSTLEATAVALEPILEDIVFVGGTIQSATNTMLRIGFQPDTSDGAPICRWVKGGLVVDLMGTTDSHFGATNPWYLEGFLTKQEIDLPKSGLRISLLSAPIFILTKWVAYQGRGKGSMTSSHDIEDILNVLDGRLGFIQEAEKASPRVRAALAQVANHLFASHLPYGSMMGLGTASAS